MKEKREETIKRLNNERLFKFVIQVILDFVKSGAFKKKPSKCFFPRFDPSYGVESR